jgi:hypothetical protein
MFKMFRQFRDTDLPSLMQTYGRVVDRAGLRRDDKTIVVIGVIVWATIRVCQVGKRTVV